MRSARKPRRSTGNTATLKRGLSAAVIAEGADDGQRTDPTDPAEREYRQLIGRANGRLRADGAVMGGRLADGPEAELQQHHKLAGNESPRGATAGA